jgi:hypothetical protein
LEEVGDDLAVDDDEQIACLTRAARVNLASASRHDLELILAIVSTRSRWSCGVLAVMQQPPKDLVD